MRIGTWNLAGRWSPGHRRLLEGAGCDVWLLTEVPAAFSLGDGELVRSEDMPRTRARSWAAIWSSEPLAAVAPAHPAAALASQDGTLLCSCVLPWRGAALTWPDDAADTAGRTAAALARLRPALVDAGRAVVWGGDWNHAMAGREYAGTKAGRAAIQDLAVAAGLQIATAEQPHAIDGLLSIDHIAVPAGARVASCRRIAAVADGRRLSDHDAYVVGLVSW